MNSKNMVQGLSADFQSSETSTELPQKKRKCAYTRRLPKDNNKSKSSGGKKNVTEKPKRNVTSNVANTARCNISIPSREVKTHTNIAHAQHPVNTNSCKPNVIASHGRGRGRACQSRNLQVQNRQRVKGVGRGGVGSHKFQDSTQMTPVVSCEKEETSGKSRSP